MNGLTWVDLERERRLRELTDLACTNPRVLAHLERSMAEEIAVRLTPELAERADALVPVFAEDPRLREWGRVSRASVVRLALDIGLRQLEEQGPTAEARGELYAQLRAGQGDLLAEVARLVAPFVEAEIRESARLAKRITDETGVAVLLQGRPGEDPAWVVTTAAGGVIARGATPGEAAQAALELLRNGKVG